MSNNTLPDDSRIEILSQRDKGEVKMILAKRITTISTVPALVSFIFAFILVLTDNFIITLFAILIYITILVRVFFYPAVLYYENVKLRTTKPAKIYFDEMDYWFKLSVVKVYVSVVIASILIFVASFYEEELINVVINSFSIKNNLIPSSAVDFVKEISFSYSLKILAFSNILMLVGYSKFINKEKKKNQDILDERMKKIRNETMTRVEQIQADKNLKKE